MICLRIPGMRGNLDVSLTQMGFALVARWSPLFFAWAELIRGRAQVYGFNFRDHPPGIGPTVSIPFGHERLRQQIDRACHNSAFPAGVLLPHRHKFVRHSPEPHHPNRFEARDEAASRRRPTQHAL